MLPYKLLLHKVDGKVYNSIQNIYASSESFVRINNELTDWFDYKTGVKQGCNLSPALFAFFANDLVKEISEVDVGITMDDIKISFLLYADDIVSITNSEDKLKAMLNLLQDRCNRWRVIINIDKSKCMHFRRCNTERTKKL